MPNFEISLDVLFSNFTLPEKNNSSLYLDDSVRNKLLYKLKVITCFWKNITHHINHNILIRLFLEQRLNETKLQKYT